MNYQMTIFQFPDISMLSEQKLLMEEELAKINYETKVKVELVSEVCNENTEKSLNSSGVNQETSSSIKSEEKIILFKANGAITFSSTDFNSRDIEVKVTQLIEENTRLKETLIQNNKNMKTQYERIKAWQEDVDRTQESHKQKFVEAKKIISSLKEENETLQRQLHDLRSNFAYEVRTKQYLENSEQYKTESLQAKCNDSEKNKNNSMEGFEDVFKENIKQLSEELYRAKQKLQYQENEYLETKRKLLEENNDLKKQLEQMKTEPTLNTQTDKLQQFLSEQGFCHQEKLYKKYEKTLVEPKLANEQWQKAQKVEENLRDELSQAKGLAEEYRMCYKIATMELQELHKKNTLLLNENQEVILRQQLMALQMTLTECETKRAVAEAQLAVKVEEMKHLSLSMPAEADMFALKTQVDLLKSDFQAERECNEGLKREKNQLAEDMQMLHKRNQQMQTEIELLREELTVRSRVRLKIVFQRYTWVGLTRYR
ncbi:hypothetical protein ABEB36_006399 [Hypothenemus hampei]|uniref:NF-kappa-B essential modulator NEMO N-terminal domain-containing protein n=1 Tax=Hypothenemus hampei TaxID=57062 RepID=A0ABD1EUB4_HYPHA